MFTDGNMPDMDGVELAKKARQIQCYSNLPVILCSANIDSFKQQAEEAGINYCLDKPAGIDTLYNAFDNCLE